jgi:hypothetical protein
MSPSDFIFYLFVSFGIGVAVAGGVVFLLIKHYLPSYLSEKGKNLATKEDIEDITEKIESVKSQYSVLLEELRVKHQLRLAALDRRLQAHQEAFTLWREVFGATHTNEVGPVVMKCQAWWEKNCLYLEPKVREAFVASCSAAHTHTGLLQSRSDAKVVTDSWNEITSFPNVLFEAIQLPALTSVETKALESKDGPTGGAKND